MSRSTEQTPSKRESGVLTPIQLLEIGIREQKTFLDLADHLVNRLPPFFGADQAVFGQLFPRQFSVKAGSAVAAVSNDSPYIQKLQGKIKVALRGDNRSTQQLSLKDVDAQSALPFGLLIPMSLGNDNRPHAVLISKSSPWKPAEIEAATYLAQVYDHAFCAALRPRRWSVRSLSKWGIRFGVLAAVTVLFLVPARVSVVAPARVVASETVTVTATITGRVLEVLAQSGAPVMKGDPLFRMDDQIARDQLAGARQNLAVSLAKQTVLQRRALTDPKAREDLAVAEAEVKVAEVDVQEAQHLLERHSITALSDGEILGSDLSALKGETVDLGEPLAQIVVPGAFEVEADVSVQDGELVYQMTSAKAFLSDAPLTARELRKLRTPSQPRQDERGGVSYPVRFDLPTDNEGLVLGMEGSVQIYGDERPLIYTLLRRPIIWVRTRLPVW